MALIEETRVPRIREDKTGLSYHDYIKRDGKAPPASLLDRGDVDLGLGGVSRKRYIDPEFHRLEMERMWPRVWQMACREEEIPETGDVHVYELGDLSLLIVRAGPDEIRAYYNSCLHRGTKLCAGDTSVQRLRCPFHGFTWGLDGRLEEVPCRWDFPQVSDDAYRLPEARVGRWGGFVFINMDPDAPPLETYLALLPEHLRSDDFENKYIAGYYRKIMPANWKASVEAFIEAFHSGETHPQGSPITDYANAQYDVWPDVAHVTRFMHHFGVQSPDIRRELSQQEILNSIFSVLWGDTAPALPAGVSARSFAAVAARDRAKAQTGRDFAWASDAEALDSIEYHLFPNLVLFHGILVPLVYRFRPNGNDPNSSIFDLIMLQPIPEGQARPEPAPVTEMGARTYTEQLGGFFGEVYDQDTQNLGLQQAGMHTARRDEMTLSHYQEKRIRKLHDTLGGYVAIPPLTTG